MPDRIYAKDPLPVRNHRRFYAGVAAVLILFLFIQAGIRIFAWKGKVQPAHDLAEDRGRAVFKEDDVVRGLEIFGKGARDSAFAKLREKEQKRASQTPASQTERLGPVAIIRHEKPDHSMPEFTVETQKPLGVPLGAQVLALLRTKIFSFNIENHVEAEAMKDLYYLGKLRIPKGTKFFGTVSVLHSENRVNVRFHRLLLPWGEERVCQAVAHALDGSGGIQGKVNRRWINRTFSIIGKTTLAGLTLFTVPNRQNAFSLDDQLRLTAVSNLAQEGSRELDTLKIDKSISVPGGVMIKIIFLESL